MQAWAMRKRVTAGRKVVLKLTSYLLSLLTSLKVSQVGWGCAVS